MGVPTVEIAGLTVSRLICGSNPFLGYSYRSAAHNAWQRRHFTPERIAEVLEKCLEVGITGLLANYEEERIIARALEETQRRCGERPTWVAYVSGDNERMHKGIRSVNDDGAAACYIQCGRGDACFTFNRAGRPLMDAGDSLDDLTEFVDLIHELGMPAGMGSHHWQILKVMDERDYNVEFMVTTLNYLGVYCEYAGAVRAINTIDRPIIAIKTLGGNARITPQDGLTCAFTALKPSDIVAVGMEHEEAAAENARLAEQIIGFLKR